MERLQIHHKKDTDTVFISFYNGSVSGTIEISAEQAQQIGAVGDMAAASKEAKRAN